MKELKKKLESGNYIFVVNSRIETGKCKIVECVGDLYIIARMGIDKIYPIHKDHKPILDAYLLDNDVSIVWIQDFEVPAVVHKCENFIQTYDEDFFYELGEVPKPKREFNFKEHESPQTIKAPNGTLEFLKPDYFIKIKRQTETGITAEIKLKDKETDYVKYNLKGVLEYSLDGYNYSKKMNLTPYKKPIEWYEDERNFPKPIVTEDGYFFIAYTLSEVADENHREILDASHDRICGLKECRPATKEEIDSLYYQGKENEAK